MTARTALEARNARAISVVAGNTERTTQMPTSATTAMKTRRRMLNVVRLRAATEGSRSASRRSYRPKARQSTMRSVTSTPTQTSARTIASTVGLE